jgi:hypothetical protein
MRDFELFVPADCVASNDERETSHALQQMATVLKADIRPSEDLDFGALTRGLQPGAGADHGLEPGR